MNYIITGGCGFIGINLCEKLLKSGYNVLALDNLSVGSLKELIDTCGGYSNFHFEQYDIFSDIKNDEIFKGSDTIYHLAGMSGVRESIEKPDVWFNNNVVGSFNILEAARKYDIKNVVMASSSASVGDVDPPVHEDIHMKPISPYGASKGFMELYTTAYYYSYGMNVTSLRFSNVYGPHSTLKTSLVAKFIRKIINGEQINIYGSGKQTRDFIYIQDLINAIQLAGEKDIGGEIFQICTGVEISVNSITKMLCDEMKLNGYDIPTINYTDPALGDILTNYADNKKAKKMLSWSPNMNVKEGLLETIKWFISKV